MKTKQIATTLSTAIFSLTILSSLNAEVFTQTYTTTPCEDYELITEMLIGPGVARHPKGVRIPQAKYYQIGVFSNMVAKAIPTFTNGVILSTGNINQGGRSETGGSLTNEISYMQWLPGESVWPLGLPPEYGSDKDLANYFGRTNLYDQAGIVLYIQPKNKTLNIPFVMASEEYFFDSDYFDSKTQEEYVRNSDKFAFFLKEIADVSNPADFDTDGNVIDDGSSMTPYWNVAQLPGGGDVEISSVNQYTNTQYFISNVVTNENGELQFPAYDINLPIEYNGAIAGPVAVAEGLRTNKIYKLKIIIADDANNIVNSAVFLRARGITSGADLSNDVCGPVKLEVPGTATFTDVVTNIDAAAADDVKVTHYLPVDINDDDLPAIKASVTCTAGEVKPESWGKQGETNYFVWTIGSRFVSGSNAVLTVNCPLPRTGIYQNITKVETSTGDMNAVNDRSECVTVVGDVEKPVLTVTAIETNKIYGTELPLAGLQFVKSIDGTNGTEIVARSVTVTYTNELGETVTPVKVGKYGIRLSNIRGDNLSDDLCDITYVDGVLTIEPAPLTITACDTNKLYGTELSFSGKEFTVAGLVGDDKVETVTLTCEGTDEDKKYKPEGYPIVASEPVSGAGLENYVFDFQPGTLTIDRLEIEITPFDQTKPYGQEFRLTPRSFKITKGELLPGDNVDSVIMTSDGASATAAASEVGYNILANGAEGDGLENYAITYGTGTLYVAKFRILITANDTNRVYGTELTVTNTAFTVQVQEPGWSNLPEGEEVLTVSLASANASNKFANARVYDGDIVPSHVITGNEKFSTNNYEIAFANGTLTVTQAVLTITANSKTRPYGTTIPVLKTDFTTNPLDLPNEETVTNVTIACPEAELPLAPLGTYPITTNGTLKVEGVNFNPDNYDIRFVPGVLTVTPTEFRASAESVVKYYDGLPTNIVVKLEGLPTDVTPTFEYSYAENEGYVPASAFTGPTNVAESAEVWCRAIAPGTTNTVHATVTILHRVVVEQADSAERAYNGKPLTNAVHFFEGAAASNLAKSVYFDLAQRDVYDGPARDDWADAVGFFDPDGIVTAPMTAASTITDPGTQPNVINPDAVTFTASTKTNNYVINYLDGKLTVTLSDALTLEVSNVEKFYDAEPTNVAYVAKVGGTPIADATVRLHERGAADWVLAADFEPYLDTTNVIVDVAVAKHGYVAVTNSATLLVKPRPVTLVAATDEKTYDGTPLTNWTFEVKADTTTPGYGFVTEKGEGVVRVEMDQASTITDPGSVDNVIATVIPNEGTKLERNYAVTKEKGTLKVTANETLTLEAAGAEKFYDGEPTNVTWTVKIGDAPATATIRLRGQGSETWISAEDFAQYRDATNVTVEVQAERTGYVTRTAQATVSVKPRQVTLVAGSEEKTYDGTPLTNWTFEVKADTTTPGYGFVTAKGEGVARVEMDMASTITDPGSVDNVIATVIPNAGTNLERNYVVTKEKGVLTVNASELLTVVAFPTEKFYDGEPTNVAWVVKIDGGQVGDATVYLREKGTETWIPAADFAYLNATNATVEVKATKTGYADATAEATVTIKPRIVVHRANDGEWVYDGAAHTQPEYFEDADEEAKLSKEKWGTDEVLANSIGFVAGEGYAADLVMTRESTIKNPGTQVNAIDLAVEKTALKANTHPENYELHYRNGLLKITPAELTITVNDVFWKVGRPRPPYGFADFSDQLKPGDTIADVIGGSGLATDVTYSNKVWTASEPTKEDKGKTYSDEIWIDLASIDGARAANYTIAVVPGAITVVSPDAKLKTTVSASLNWNTGLLDLELTVENLGMDEVDPDYDYWVELVPGPADTGAIAKVNRTYYLNARTGVLINGADYVELTAAVKSALKSVGDRDEVFDPHEKITVTGVSVYHWKRWSPDEFIDANNFFVAGLLSERRLGAEVQNSSEEGKASLLHMVSNTSEPDRTDERSEQVETSEANVFDGMLYRGGALAGTLQVKLAKANRKTGLSKLTATIVPVGEKKISVSGNFDPNTSVFVATAKDGRMFELVVSKNGIGGTFGDFKIDGARNRYSSKDSDDKSVVAAADGWIGSYSIVSLGENGWDSYVVTIAKKGKVKIAGTLADGSTVAASAQMIIGAERCGIPVVISKKTATRAFCLLLGEDGIAVVGLDDAVVGQAKNISETATFGFDVNGLVALLEGETVEVLTEYLPNGAEILPCGSKWIVMPDENGKAMKSGKLSWDRKSGEINEEKSKVEGFNVSGLKLSYVANKGTFKGSFKVYTIVNGALKSTSVTVAGVMVDGIGYGTAKVGKIGVVAVVIE